MDVTDSRSRIRPAIAPILILGLLAIFLFPRQTASQAQETSAALTEVRVLEAEDTGVAHPVGLAFSFHTETFHLQAGHQVAGLELVQLDAFGLETSSQVVASAHLTGETGAILSQEPLPMAFDQQGNRLLMLQPATGQQPARLVEVPEHGDGGLDAEATSAHDVSQFAVQQPLAMAVDAHSG